MAGRKARPKELPEGQLDLITAGALGDGFSDPAASGGGVRVQWTADQIKTRRPETYRDVLDMLAGGMPVIRIAKCLHLSPESVRAIRAAGCVSLGQHKQRLGVQQLFGCELAVESVIEDLSNEHTRATISTKDKAVIAGILGQRGQELVNGGVSVSVNVGVQLSPDDYRKLLESGAMGSGGGFAGQKAPASGAPDADQAQPRELTPDDLRAGGEVIDLPPDTSAQAAD